MNNQGVAPRSSTAALVALIMAIASFVVFPFVLSIAALVVGYRAKKEIEAGQGMITGEGQAKWAVILGWISLIWGVIAVIYLATTVM